MFNQTHRKIILLKDRVRRYYLDKESFVLRVSLIKYLDQLSLGPKIIMINHDLNYYEEQRLNKEKSKNKLNKKNISKIAKMLYKLHELKLPNQRLRLLVDKFTKDGYYHPQQIFDEGLKNLPDKKQVLFLKYKSLVKQLEIKFMNIHNALCLIHADVKQDNIFFCKSKLKMIDWDDARIDLPLLDIYSVFRNYKFTKLQKGTFWSFYKKPNYLDKNLDLFLNLITKIYEQIPEALTIIIPTHNRCPNNNPFLNPLYVTLFSLLYGDKTKIIRTVIIADDCSSDYTFQIYKFLESKFKSVKFIYFRNTKRLKASLTRQRALTKCQTELFLMSDDDCIYPKNFIRNSYKLYKKVRQTDRNIAILSLPYVNRKFNFNGVIHVKKYGRVDFKNHWIYHNFDKLPLRKNENEYIKIETFEGLFIGVKSRILSAGGFENLNDFIIDYAEFISLSTRLIDEGYTFYGAVGKKFLVTHLKYGYHDPNQKLIGIPQKYKFIFNTANEANDIRISKFKILESLISSFTYFYLTLSVNQGIKHIYKEREYLIRDNDVTPDTIQAYKNGVLTGIEVARKKGYINKDHKSKCTIVLNNNIIYLTGQIRAC
mgnify:CR=1 FL=1